MTEEQELPRCEGCAEESEELLPCEDCGLHLCPTCLNTHECDEEDL